ncbi:MAG: lamin tail domain-containing protein, partial [Candidatus Marinimicrobia bacterium]|nr:lamin tail domain-containing protein [Candidatus Neomarinimicrobiota bacterium]
MKMSKIVSIAMVLMLLLVLSPMKTSAQWGNCLHFIQEEHDKVTVYDTPSLWPGMLAAGTVEMWFKPDTIYKGDTHGPDYNYIFCKNISGNWVGDMGLHWYRDEGIMKCFIQSGDAANYPTQLIQSDNDVFDARWYHVAYVWDTEDSMRLFIDGKQQQEMEPNTEGEKCYGVSNGTQLINIGIGCQDLWYQRYETWPGCIDEVRVSGIARYTADFDVPEEPLEADAYTIALWHLDEGSGTVAEDASGYGFTGTLGDPDSSLGFATPEWVKVIRDSRILINEVLADPHDDAQYGDANGDGTRDALQDEFVELVNVSPKAVDLTGWKLGDDDALNFQFPDGYILQQNEFVVIFGGGNVTGFPGYDADLLKTKVFTAGGSIGDGLDEAGDYVVMQSVNGLDNTYLAFGSVAGAGEPTSTAVSDLTWEFKLSTAVNTANDNSITRSPDAGQEQDDPFTEHLNVSTAYFSPGTTVEGFATLAYTLTVNVSPAGAGSVELDEVSATKTEFGYGDIVTLTAHANGLYIFDQWSGDETAIVNPVTISMKSSKVITANFINAFQQPVSIIINEINADPSNDPILGDANGDGVRHPQQDE